MYLRISEPSPARPGPCDRTTNPHDFDVLVLDAASRQSLATLRSLGRAGLRVAVGEAFVECDPDLPVPAFTSRYARRTVVLPNFAADAPAFAAAVLDFVREHPTAVVIPASDGSVSALLSVRDDLAALGCRLALASTPTLEIANSKARTIEVARELGIESPVTRRVRDATELADALADSSFPLVLKPTRSWAPGGKRRTQAVDVVSPQEAVAVATALFAAGHEVLLQPWINGTREGVTLIVQGGAVRAAFAHREHRTSPAIGGASVLRESIDLPPDLLAASVGLVRAIGLEGLSEVEFRRDGEGRPLLMEINARLPGTTETAMAAGVDLPLLLWKWATDEPIREVGPYASGVRRRWLRGDMRWLRDNYARAGRPDGVGRARALRAFAADFFRPVGYDGFDLRDLRPFLAELRITAAAVRGRPRSRP